MLLLGVSAAFVGTASAQLTTAEQGTAAGQSVSNTFTLDYEVNDEPQTTIDNNDAPTVFNVDRLIDVTVLATNTPQFVTPGTAATLTFNVTNTGNDNQAYSFSLEDLSSTFAATGVVISVSTDPVAAASPTFTPIAPVAVGGTAGAGEFTPDILPGQTFRVTVTGTIPGGLANGLLDNVILVAETRDPTAWINPGASPLPSTGAVTTATSITDAFAATTVQTVFADADGDGADVDFDGRHADTGTFNVLVASVTGVKTVEVVAANNVTPAECADFVTALPAPPPDIPLFATPGACVQYNITVTNGGATTTPGGSIQLPFDQTLATDIVIADTLPNGLIFQAARAVGFTIVHPDGTTGPLAPPAATATGAPTTNENCNGGPECLVAFEGGFLTANPGGGPAGSPTGAGNIARVEIRAIVQN